MTSIGSLAGITETENLRPGLNYMYVGYSILAFLFGVWLLRNRRVKHGFPGPGRYFLGGIVNGLAIRNMKTTLSVFDRWCRKYGGVFEGKFFSKSVIVLNSPDYVQKLLGSTDMNYHGKGFIYKAFRASWKDGLIISTGEKWKLRRKLLDKHVFSYNALSSYMGIINEEANVVVKTLQGNGDETEMVVDGLLKNYTLSSITKSTLGQAPDAFVKEAGDFSLESMFYRMKEIMSKRILEPWLLFDPIWKLHPLSKVEDAITKVAWKQAQAALTSTKVDGLKNFPSLKGELLATGISIEGIWEETVTLISAGYETSKSTLEFLLFMLALHPRHQQLCREEVQALFPNEDDWINLEFQDLSKLKHLEMCVNETLRLFPIVFLIMRKLTAPLQLEKDLKIDAGADVAIYIPGLHRNPQLFPNPDDFIPERFSAEEYKNRHPYAFIPFSAGPRKCIGYRFAMMEIICLTAKLLRCFDISTLDKIEDLVLLPNMSLTLEKPIRFIFEKRRI